MQLVSLFPIFQVQVQNFLKEKPTNQTNNSLPPPPPPENKQATPNLQLESQKTVILSG